MTTGTAHQPAQRPGDVTILQFQRQGDRLMASLMRGVERLDAPPFDDGSMLMKWSTDFTSMMESALNFPHTNHHGEMVEYGRCLFDNLLDGDVAEALRHGDEGTPLLVDLPESLLWLPVEAMYTGSEFLGMRYSLGRRITAWEGRRRQAATPRQDGTGRPAFLLVAGNAENDAFFEETRKEIYGLGQKLEHSEAFEMKELLVDNTIDRADLLRALCGADFIHYSGHSDSAAMGGRAGWAFDGYRLEPDAIESLSGCDPQFVFSNSCRSSAVLHWNEVRDMVRAFWERGTRHYIGANTRVHYRRAAEFAGAFYQHFLEGSTVGEAVRQARRAVLSNQSTHDPSWMSYVLYGDPTYRLPLPGASQSAPQALARPASPAPALPVVAAVAPVASGYDAVFAKCGWTGRRVARSGATPCSEYGCSELLSTDAVIEQRRAWIDLALHDPQSGAYQLRRNAYCRRHAPAMLIAWMERSGRATSVVAAGQAACAWTGAVASRADILSGAFLETPHGLMGPDARKRYTCADTGTIIPPDDARAGRGFIVWLGKPLTEAAYWRRLKADGRPALTLAEAHDIDKVARQAMRRRLAELTELEIAGDGTYRGLTLQPPLRDTDDEWAAMLEGRAGLLSAGLRLAIIHRIVLHEQHYERFGCDRAPAGIDDLERHGRTLAPVRGARHTLAVLASPTGWTEEARQQARQLDPGTVALILRNTGTRGEALAFNNSFAPADALKLDLAGGLA